MPRSCNYGYKWSAFSFPSGLSSLDYLIPPHLFLSQPFPPAPIIPGDFLTSPVGQVLLQPVRNLSFPETPPPGKSPLPTSHSLLGVGVRQGSGGLARGKRWSSHVPSPPCPPGARGQPVEGTARRRWDVPLPSRQQGCWGGNPRERNERREGGQTPSARHPCDLCLQRGQR